MFSGQARKAKILFAGADLLITAVAFQAAYETRLGLHLPREFAIGAKPLLLAFCVLIWTASGWWLDVYSRLAKGMWRFVIRDAFRQAMLGTLCLLVFEFLLRLDLSRLFIGVFAVYSGSLLLLFRLVAIRLTGRFRRMTQRYVLVVGTGERAMRLGEALEQAQDDGVVLSGFLATSPAETGAVLARGHVAQPLEELPQLLRQQVVDEIIFAVDSPELPELEDIFLLCDEEGVRTRLAVDFFPHVNSQIRLENLGETKLLTFSAAPDDDLRLLVKRAIDLSLATLGLLIGLPALLAIALAVRLTSPGPAIFFQERCGLNGRKFRCYKFRSMTLGAESKVAEVAHLSSRHTAVKIPNDPRLTPLGRYLRRFSLDELPQLLNVIRGEMSMVGPRPAIPSEVEQYQRWQRRRLRMRPGLTSLWAVEGRDRVDFETWMKLDLQYIDNWSLGLDWKILLRTIPQVLTGRGAS